MKQTKIAKNDSLKGKVISVIVAIYNIENYLAKCIESIIAQKYENLEIILVNDGSTDGCQKICEDYAKKDKRIKVVNKPNGGLSSARNEGLKNATGDYIAFVDGDDYLEPEMYYKLLTKAQNSNADLCFCRFFKVFENSDEKISINELKLKELSASNFCNAIISIGQHRSGSEIKTTNVMGNVWRVLFRKEIIKGLKYRENFCPEDIEFLLQIINKKDVKFSIVDEPLYNYLQRSNSILHKQSMKKSLTLIDSYDEILSILDGKCDINLLKAYKYYLYSCRINEMIKSDNFDGLYEIEKNEKLSKLNTKENYKSAKKNIKSFKHKVAFFLIRHRFYRLYRLLCKFV